ncbi:Acyl-coenzyme A oxidase 2 [Tephrocybe sp. NHM501043]|nr:Acyl-coenzyme A oxidase 2 [Tephrocybe sp. NHM501043]
MFNQAKSLWAFALFTVTNAAIGPVSDLVISNAVVSPDGFSRSAVLAGGTYPGPVITGKKGDRFQLNVIDALTDNTMLRSTSIHWHGILQNKTNWEDGVSFITQCPIAANDSFVYDFRVYDQAGTFWYHSHLSTQYCDGLRGPFIIYDPSDPHKSLYDVDNESTIITLSDWYHEPAPSANGGLPLVSQAVLINGKGRYLDGPAVDLAVINVVPNKRYRFRIIAMSCEPSFAFSIDNHSLTIIEADGENTQPLVVDSFQIYAGQRYSAILNANQPVGNYWIRADSDMRGVPGFDGGRNSAILRYSGAAEEEPTSTFTPSNPLKEVNLHALTNAAAPGNPWVGGADVNINLNHGFNFDTFHYEINGVPFIPPTVPVLLQILSGAQAAQDLLPQGAVYSLPPNKVIEISMPGTGVELGGPHPFHLHGHTFSVIRSGDNETYNFKNPVRRDTVNLGLADGNATIRFVTDNAGPWFLHCHIDWHLELGLAIVFAEDVATTTKIDPPSKLLIELRKKSPN